MNFRIINGNIICNCGYEFSPFDLGGSTCAGCGQECGEQEIEVDGRWYVKPSDDLEKLFERSAQTDLNQFREEHCTGKQYDSCVNSPCRYSSSSGCTHPEHPSNKV